MGAVIRLASDGPDPVDLLPPEGRDFGTEMWLAVHKYLENLQSTTRIAYMDHVRSTGGTYDRYGSDFALGSRAELPEDMFPKKVIVPTGITIPDFYSNFGFWFVSDAFKNLVEQFDDQKHQFVPVEVLDSDGTAYMKSKYWCFKARQVLDAIDDTSESIKLHDQSRPGKKDPVPFTFTVLNPFRMFKSEIGTAGIWQELRCLSSFFASEAFLEEASARKLTGIRRYTDFAEI